MYAGHTPASTRGAVEKWPNSKAALALHFAFYNFCRMHSSIRCTHAMATDITKHVRELKELLRNG